MTKLDIHERLAAKEAETAKLREKAAIEDAKKNPTLAPLVEMIEETKVEKLALSRKHSGPQSFLNRLAKKQLWVDQIRMEMRLNLAETAVSTDRIQSLQDTLAAFSEALTSGDSINDSDVQDALDEISGSDNVVENLKGELEDAIDARLNYGKKEADPELEMGA